MKEATDETLNHPADDTTLIHRNSRNKFLFYPFNLYSTGWTAVRLESLLHGRPGQEGNGEVLVVLMLFWIHLQLLAHGGSHGRLGPSEWCVNSQGWLNVSIMCVGMRAIIIPVKTCQRTHISVYVLKSRGKYSPPHLHSEPTTSAYPYPSFTQRSVPVDLLIWTEDSCTL